MGDSGKQGRSHLGDDSLILHTMDISFLVQGLYLSWGVLGCNCNHLKIPRNPPGILGTPKGSDGGVPICAGATFLQAAPWHEDRKDIRTQSLPVLEWPHPIRCLHLAVSTKACPWLWRGWGAAPGRSGCTRGRAGRRLETLAEARMLRALPQHPWQHYIHLQSSATGSFGLPGGAPCTQGRSRAGGHRHPLLTPEPCISPPTPTVGRAGTCSWPRRDTGHLGHIADPLPILF